MIKLIGNKEGLIPKGVKDINDSENHYWLIGHIYDVPKGFFINKNIFETIEKKAPTKTKEVKNEY